MATRRDCCCCCCSVSCGACWPYHQGCYGKPVATRQWKLVCTIAVRLGKSQRHTTGGTTTTEKGLDKKPKAPSTGSSSRMHNESLSLSLTRVCLVQTSTVTVTVTPSPCLVHAHAQQMDATRTLPTYAGITKRCCKLATAAFLQSNPTFLFYL